MCMHVFVCVCVCVHACVCVRACAHVCVHVTSTKGVACCQSEKSGSVRKGFHYTLAVSCPDAVFLSSS